MLRLGWWPVILMALFALVIVSRPSVAAGDCNDPCVDPLVESWTQGEQEAPAPEQSPLDLDADGDGSDGEGEGEGDGDAPERLVGNAYSTHVPPPLLERQLARSSAARRDGAVVAELYRPPRR